MADDLVSVVMPTHFRSELIVDAVERVLKQPFVAEVVVVNDGSDPGTSEALELAKLGPKVSVVETAWVGLPAARNLGAAHASFPLVLFTDDDDRLANNYVETLRSIILDGPADVASGPCLPASLGASDEAKLASARERSRASDRSQPSRLRWLGASYVPENDIETPFQTSKLMARRVALQRVHFDTRFTGNFFREETSFCLDCYGNGLRLVRTGRTYSIAGGPGLGGGSKWMGSVRYEYYRLRNEIRFHRKHAEQLKDMGIELPSPAQSLRTRLEKVGSAVLTRMWHKTAAPEEAG